MKQLADLEEKIDVEIQQHNIVVNPETYFTVVLKISQDGIGSTPELRERERTAVLPDKVFR